jgi:hypothetical protein
MVLTTGASRSPFRRSELRLSAYTKLYSLAPILILVGIALLVAAWSWRELGQFASGNDPGNWLAVGRRLLGDHGKSSRVAYAPAVPFIVAVLSALMGPFVAVKLTAALSLAAAFFCVALVARSGVELWLAIAAGLLVTLSRVFDEPMYFGGYPQNFAVALTPVALLCFATYLQTGRTRPKIGATLALSAIALIHQVFFVLAIAACGLIWLLWLASPELREHTIGRSLGAATAVAVAIAFLLPTALMLRSAGYSAPLKVTHTSLTGGLVYGFGEPSTLYVALFVFAGAYLLLSSPYEGRPLWLTGTALFTLFGLAFLVTDQVRLFPLMLEGAVLGAAMALEELRRRFNSATARLAIAGVLVLGLGSLVHSTHDLNPQISSYYAVADGNLESASMWLDAHPSRGAVAVASTGSGWPIGWWFEGLTDRRILVGSDAEWLGFPEEKAHATIVQRLVDQSSSSADAAAVARREGIEYLVLPASRSDVWQAWLRESRPAVTMDFHNDGFVILAFAQDAGSLR